MAKFNFLNKPQDPDKNHPIYKILDESGKEIEEYAKDYFKYEVISYEYSFSLKILLPKLKYDHDIINVDISSWNANEGALITFYPFRSIPLFKIGYGEDQAKQIIDVFLSSQEANFSFKLLVEIVDNEGVE